jgi:hypothetical protein
MLRLFNWIGLTRVREDGTIYWPISVSPWTFWKIALQHPFEKQFGAFGVFRNKSGVVKWVSGRLLPRRWGVRILGLEIGDRG